MVQGAKHMKGNNTADNGDSSPQPKSLNQSPNVVASGCRAGPTGSSLSSSSLLAWAL